VGAALCGAALSMWLVSACDSGEGASPESTEGADSADGGGLGDSGPGGIGELADAAPDSAGQPPEDTVGTGQDSSAEPGDTGSPVADAGVADVVVEQDASPSDGGGQPCEPPPGTPTWNEEVGAILTVKCGLCHGAEPVFGAPMGLTAYEAMQQASLLEPDQKLYERVAARILDGSMPPPSQPMLTPEEREAVLAWAQGCAPEGSGTFVPPELPQGTYQPPPPPEGAKVVEVRANGYKVPLKDDQYMCFPLTLDLDEPMHVVRFGIDLDKTSVLHHAVLYSDPNKLAPKTPFSCDGTPEQSQFMYAWAPGGTDLQFPKNYGFPVNSGDVVVLQIHYNNLVKTEDVVDDTGVLLYLTPPQPNEVGMVATGKLGFSVPPFEEVEIVSQCRPKHDITIVASMPHMHQIGKRFEHWIERADGGTEDIVTVENWSFYDQPFYWTPKVVKAEDRMITRCTYQNTNAFTVYFGEDTHDEMCFNFFYHYPPLGYAFCDELLDEEKAIAYSPGVCAAGIAPPDPPLAIGGVKLSGDVTKKYGGLEPQGSWVVEQIDVVLPFLLTPAGEIDPDATQLVAKGYLSESNGNLTLDAVVVGDLKSKQGAGYPFDFAVSLSGSWKILSNGAVTIEPECTNGLQISAIRFSMVGSKLGAMITAQIPGAGFSLDFETLWGPAP
jgi:mono/diheme cytochrome c family protein